MRAYYTRNYFGLRKQFAGLITHKMSLNTEGGADIGSTPPFFPRNFVQRLMITTMPSPMLTTAPIIALLETNKAIIVSIIISPIQLPSTWTRQSFSKMQPMTSGTSYVSKRTEDSTEDA